MARGLDGEPTGSGAGSQFGAGQCGMAAGWLRDADGAGLIYGVYGVGLPLDKSVKCVTRLQIADRVLAAPRRRPRSRAEV